MGGFSTFIESLGLRERFRRESDRIAAERPSAQAQGKQECCRSGNCCWRRPGALSAEDVGRIAARTGLTPGELFRRLLVVDTVQVGGGEFSLHPIRRHQGSLAGGAVPWRETYSLESPCVWLGEGGGCEVHDVKPETCASFRCWVPGSGVGSPPWTREQLVALGWDGVWPDGEAEE